MQGMIGVGVGIWLSTIRGDASSGIGAEIPADALLDDDNATVLYDDDGSTVLTDG